MTKTFFKLYQTHLFFKIETIEKHFELGDGTATCPAGFNLLSCGWKSGEQKALLF
jgi:hypothetical protein